MGVFVYIFFGTSKDITLGPTAILSLVTASVINDEDDPEIKVHLAILLTFVSGVVQVLLGLLNFGEFSNLGQVLTYCRWSLMYIFCFSGWLVDFISLPVISGFTSGAAITIAMGQVKVNTAVMTVYQRGGATIVSNAHWSTSNFSFVTVYNKCFE